MEIKKDFKSTKNLYGVSPLHFENMFYYEAIKEKLRLVRKRIAELSKELIPNTPNYVDITSQIYECKKAEIFNESLLKEYEKAKKEKLKTYNNLSNSFFIHKKVK